MTIVRVKLSIAVSTLWCQSVLHLLKEGSLRSLCKVATGKCDIVEVFQLIFIQEIIYRLYRNGNSINFSAYDCRSKKF